MLKYLDVFVLGCLVQTIYAGSVSFITPCKSHDQKCLIKSTQVAIAAYVKGLPEYGIPTSDPMYLKGGESLNSGLNIKYKNVNVYGLNKAKVVNVARDKSNIKFDLELPLKIQGQYDLKGKILFLEVLGKGDVDIETDNIRFNIVLKTTTVKGSDGKDHWKITGFDYTYDLLKKVDIKLSGLFDGNEEKAKPIRALFDSSYKEIIEEIGEPIIKEVLNINFKYVNNFFQQVPSEDLQIV